MFLERENTVESKLKSATFMPQPEFAIVELISRIEAYPELPQKQPLG